MSRPDHRPFEEELAAYAIGALDATEAESFEAHLAGCDSCQAQLLWLAPAVDLLPASVEQIEPPPSLRSAILDTVGAETTNASKRRRLRWPSWRAQWPRTAIASAATATVLVALAMGYLLGDSQESAPATLAVPVETSAPQMDAAATLLHRGDIWTLDVRRLPQLPPNEVYQVWIRHGRELAPSTLFVLSRDGTATVAVPGQLADADELMVTREPHGGSNVPTSTPLLRAQLPS